MGESNIKPIKRRWNTNNGHVLEMCQMDNNHLINAIRMSLRGKDFTLDDLWTEFYTHFSKAKGDRIKRLEIAVCHLESKAFELEIPDYTLDLFKEIVRRDITELPDGETEILEDESFADLSDALAYAREYLTTNNIPVGDNPVVAVRADSNGRLNINWAEWNNNNSDPRHEFRLRTQGVWNFDAPPTIEDICDDPDCEDCNSEEQD